MNLPPRFRDSDVMIRVTHVSAAALVLAWASWSIHAQEPDSYPPPTFAITPEPVPKSPTVSVSGTIRDQTGIGLPGMHVCLRLPQRGYTYSFCIEHNHEWLATTTSDEHGRFAFDEIGIPPRMADSIAKLRGGNGNAQLIAWGPGKAIAWTTLESFVEKDKEIVLQDEVVATGTVVDETGKLVPDMHFYVRGITKGRQDRREIMGAPDDLKFYLSHHRFRAFSKDGRFRLTNLPRDHFCLIWAESETGHKEVFWFDPSDDKPSPGAVTLGNLNVYQSPVRCRPTQHAYVNVRVQDHNGQPVSGGGLMATTETGGFGGSARVAADGRARLLVFEPGETLPPLRRRSATTSTKRYDRGRSSDRTNTQRRDSFTTTQAAARPSYRRRDRSACRGCPFARLEP